MADQGNVLLDFEIGTEEAGVVGANRLIKASNRMVRNMQNYLQQVRTTVSTYGKPELIAALGTPAAAEMQALYLRAVAFIEATATEAVVLPMEEVE